MATHKTVAATGTIDGANRVFGAGEAYRAGSMTHSLNGLHRIPADDDGLAETDPAAGTVTLAEAPQAAPAPADRVLLHFVDETPNVQVVEPISADLELAELVGELETDIEIAVSVAVVVADDVVELVGDIADNRLEGDI